MHKRLVFLAVLSLTLLVPASLSRRGAASPPSDENRSAETTVDVEEYLYSQLRQHNMIIEPKLSFSIYVQKLQGRKLVKFVMKHKDAHGKIDWVIHARTAELKVLAVKRQLHFHLLQGEAFGDDSRTTFESKDFVFDLPKDFDPK